MCAADMLSLTCNESESPGDTTCKLGVMVTGFTNVYNCVDYHLSWSTN